MIAPEFNDKLMAALRDAVGHFNTGDDPTTAVTKSADAHDFNTDQTRRLCETFNTARTIYHFHNTPEKDKAASFPLADGDEVLQRLFKPAAPKRASTSLLDGAYERPELRWRDGEESAAIGELTPKAAEDIVDVNAQAQRAYRIIDTQRTMAKHALDDAGQAELVADNRLEAVANDLIYGYPVDGVVKYARLLRSYDGQSEFAPVLQKLAAYLPVYLRVEPAELTKLGHVIDTAGLEDLQEKLAEAKLLMTEAAMVRAAGIEMAKEADTFEKDFLELIVPQSGGEQDFFGLTSQAAAYDKEQAKAQEKPLLTLETLFGEMPSKKPDADQSVGPSGLAQLARAPREGAHKAIAGTAEDLISSGLQGMITAPAAAENKKMTERLHNVQREIMLQDLLMNDPIISEADPQHVANAFSAILQLAPKMSMNKEVVRAILRQSIHSATPISPFDASTWTDLEKNLRELEGTLVRPGAPQKGGTR